MTIKQRILVVDDEKDVVTGFRRVFAKDEIQIDAAHTSMEALQAIKTHRPDLVMMDLRMPGMDGLETLKKIKSYDPKIMIILMTAFSTSANVIEAMKFGAYDYLSKPFSVEKLREVVREALKTAQDMKTVVNYEPRMEEEEHTQSIIGKADAIQQVFKMVGQVAASNATVLVTGESGTGKELVARAIYSHSDRNEKPFVTVNCAAIPEALLESELFGHEKGAYTSATSRRLGKFEMANEGTLFLDEIGDMSLGTQTKILRVLQSGEFERIGGTETLRVNVRIIAATNRNLEMMMEDGTFRPDLYYRLNVVRMRTPPLRDRREDIPLLIEYFLRMYTKDRKDRQLNISNAAMERLKSHDWPGNVRQLENTIRNAVLTAKGDTILTSDIRLQDTGEKSRPDTPASFVRPVMVEEKKLGPITPTTVVADPAFEDIENLVAPIFETLVEARERGHKFSTFDVMERALLVHALNKTKGNQLKASKILGITRSTLRKRLQRYGIRIDTTVRG